MGEPHLASALESGNHQSVETIGQQCLWSATGSHCCCSLWLC